MTADTLTTRNERTISGAAAAATHLIFFALLVFGVSWQRQQPEAIVVDLWNNLPPLPAPPVKVESQPPPPKPVPVPKVEPAPAPKAAPKPEIKPDIALREKQEKERKRREEQLAAKMLQEQELAARKRREQELAVKKKREQEQAQIAALKEQQAREEAVRQRAAREQEEAMKKLAAQQAAAQASLLNEYKSRIRDRIRRFVIAPPNLQGNPEVEMDVVLLPGGEVLSVNTRKASGSSAWDTAVERAILKAQPLPLPPDPRLFQNFRELNLKFRPKE